LQRNSVTDGRCEEEEEKKVESVKKDFLECDSMSDGHQRRHSFLQLDSVTGVRCGVDGRCIFPYIQMQQSIIYIT
jgi:hypothetical protein